MILWSILWEWPQAMKVLSRKTHFVAPFFMRLFLWIVTITILIMVLLWNSIDKRLGLVRLNNIDINRWTRICVFYISITINKPSISPLHRTNVRIISLDYIPYLKKIVVDVTLWSRCQIWKCSYRYIMNLIIFALFCLFAISLKDNQPLFYPMYQSNYNRISYVL